jgi:hypothetical protein
MRQCRVERVHHAFDVDVDLQVFLCRRDLVVRRHEQHAGVGKDCAELAVAACGEVIHRTRDGRTITHIRHVRREALAPDGVRQRLDHRRAQVTAPNVPALGRKELSRGGADTAPDAGDEDGSGHGSIVHG